jgi:hypothetical protein
LMTRTICSEESLLRSYQRINPGPRYVCMFRNNGSFYGEELLAPHPTPKLKDHPLSAAYDYLFGVFAAPLHTWRPFLHPQPEDAPFRWQGPTDHGNVLAKVKPLQNADYPNGNLRNRGSAPTAVTGFIIIGLWWHAESGVYQWPRNVS